MARLPLTSLLVDARDDGMETYILALMLLCPRAHAPTDRREEVAHAIDVAAHENPLYDTPDGVERTVRELVAVDCFESAFNPLAIGDHGSSLGLAQVGISNVAMLGLHNDSELLDPVKNQRAALTMMRASHRTCRGRPSLERLGQYASGGPTCSVPQGLAASRRRTKFAEDLAKVRVFWTSAP